MTERNLPDWITYPEDSWEHVSPHEVGLDAGAWNDFLESLDVRAENWEGEQHGEGEWGVVLTRGGRILQTWGNPDYKFQTASLGKAFVWACFGLAVDDGLVSPDDLVSETWTGEGQLSHPHKYLDAGFHKTLKWRHLLGSTEFYGHEGGFPVTNGFFWRQKSSAQMASQADLGIPEWANWTGDPFYDNYSHAEPGTVRTYASGGMWRLTQLLTVLWNRDLKELMDDRIFGVIGVPADEWDWTPGRTVFETKDYYPHMPGYGEFLDPPYEINGHPVRGGPGWVVMSASNLARFGHLVACGGLWNGERIMSSDWLRGHRGGNGSEVAGEGRNYTAMGRVTAVGLDFPLPGELFENSAKV